MLDKEALEYLVNLGIKYNPIVEVNDRYYSVEDLQLINDPKPIELVTTTLTSLVDYLLSGIAREENGNGLLIVHVVSPACVRLFSKLDKGCQRNIYIECQALLPVIHYDTFLNVESFNIMLQSNFVESQDRDVLLKVTGLIQDKEVTEVGDDGISQQVTMKTGIAKVGNVVVPNPVVLAPYRTFPEIEQPESKFIFRMKSGPAAAIFEADGGAWRNKAMRSIKEFLFTELIEKGEMDDLVQIIS